MRAGSAQGPACWDWWRCYRRDSPRNHCAAALEATWQRMHHMLDPTAFAHPPHWTSGRPVVRPCMTATARNVAALLVAQNRGHDGVWWPAQATYKDCRHDYPRSTSTATLRKNCQLAIIVDSCKNNILCQMQNIRMFRIEHFRALNNHIPVW